MSAAAPDALDAWGAGGCKRSEEEVRGATGLGGNGYAHDTTELDGGWTDDGCLRTMVTIRYSCLRDNHFCTYMQQRRTDDPLWATNASINNGRV